MNLFLCFLEVRRPVNGGHLLKKLGKELFPLFLDHQNLSQGYIPVAVGQTAEDLDPMQAVRLSVEATDVREHWSEMPDAFAFVYRAADPASGAIRADSDALILRLMSVGELFFYRLVHAPLMVRLYALSVCLIFHTALFFRERV